MPCFQPIEQTCNHRNSERTQFVQDPEMHCGIQAMVPSHVYQ